MLSSPWLSLGLVALVAAQFPPEPKGVKVIKSKFHEGVTISYKEPKICETTPGVRSYSGYVHLPPDSLNEPGEDQGYPINTFFWFFEARNDPHNAPLSIWLNGGPGGSSMIGLLAENGPCFIGKDSNSTHLNPWSWSNHVNMLYIDQPNQVGFSYDVLTNVTTNLFANGETQPASVPADFSDGVPAQNHTFFAGTMGSQKPISTANSTSHSAIALWHFAQTWFEEFPAYKPNDNRCSLWTESYGGRYGPAIVSYWERQNELIANGTISGPGVHYIHLDTLGIINGCVDSILQDKNYVKFLRDNTYGIDAFRDDEEYEEMLEIIVGPGGTNDQTRHCRKLAAKLDPSNIGDVEEVNAVCRNAASKLEEEAIGWFQNKTVYGWFDITHEFADPFPDPYFGGFLNQHWVQEALGVPVNFSKSSSAVMQSFRREGDMHRTGQLNELAYILDHGIKVALVYGDRDFACSWIGGEEVSTSIPYSKQSSFESAGYAAIRTNPFYSGGQTRQYGNLSFSRVYQAGHMVPSYQPETAYEIFMRAMFNKDIATGELELHDELATVGPNTTLRILNDLLPAPEPVCYVDVGLETCTEKHKQWLQDGSAIIKDRIVVGRDTGSARNDLVTYPGVEEQVPFAA